MSLEELKRVLKEHEEAIGVWRLEEQAGHNSDWNVGYNDGFEDCYKAIKKAMRIT